MKKIFFLILIFATGTAYAQSYYVNTDLLNVRKEPNTQSRVVNALPYLSRVFVSSRDSVFQKYIEFDGKLFFGEWLWLDYCHPGSIRSAEIMIDDPEYQGFVFDEFLTPTFDRDAISYEVISKTEYDNLISKAPKATTKVTKITDPNKIVKLLGDKIDSAEIEVADHDGGYIKFRSVKDDLGHTFLNADDEETIVAYYPDFKILKLEGGHAADDFIDLKHGVSSEMIGDPEFAQSSPNANYRIGGFYDGNEPVIFLEKKVKDRYQFMTEIRLLFYEFAWIDGNTFLATNERDDETDSHDVKHLKCTVLK